MKQAGLLLAIMIFLPLVATQPATGDNLLDPCGSVPHNIVTVTGPDGETYPTWHPQVNMYSAERWCHHGHEHGTNPVTLIPGYQPVYGYVGSKAGMDEPHKGFKGFGLHDRNGNIWYITVHLGSSGIGRLCMSFHSVSIYIADGHTFEPLVDVHFMGDFGPAVRNTDSQPYTPIACPDQYQEATQRTGDGVRMIPMAIDGQEGYEPWRLAYFDNIIGFNSGHMTFNTFNPMTICSDLDCSELVSVDNAYGERRFLSYNSNQLGFFNPPHTGEFYTDPYGVELRDGTELDAVRQYIKPGLEAIAAPYRQSGELCFWRDPWSMTYICGPMPWHISNGAGANLFGGLKAGN
jgi:hypothetical protein